MPTMLTNEAKTCKVRPPPLKKPVKVLVGNQEILQEVEMFQY